MIHRWIVMIISLVFVAFFLGCRQSHLHVKIIPSDTRMEEVRFDDRKVDPSPGGNGIYESRVSIERGAESKDVRVRAKSEGGIIVEKSFSVTIGQTESRQLAMPAELIVNVESSEPNRALVQFDGELIEQKNGSFRKFFEADQLPRYVKIQADDRSTGLVDVEHAEVKAGQRVRKTLHLNPMLMFTVDPDVIQYGRTIIFDASDTRPKHSVTAYIWDFGDGSDSQKGERISHTYEVDREIGSVDHYPVTLRVRWGSLERQVSKSIRVENRKLDLRFDVRMYPEKDAYAPGDSVEFVLMAIDPAYAGAAEDIVFFADEMDRSSNSKPINLNCSSTECEPIAISFSYQKRGEFIPELIYRSPSLGIVDAERAQLQGKTGSQLMVLVEEDYLTDEELIEQAWLDFYRQFKKLLKDDGIDEQIITLASLEWANFEARQPELVPVVDRLTRMLVEDEDKFRVLERKSQVLARLAHEAVVDVLPELGANGRQTFELDGEPQYRSSLDYGLATQHHGVEAPIVYTIELTGTEDRINRLGELSQSIMNREALIAPKRAEAQGAVAEQEFTGHLWLQNLPILMARFKTAEVLIALRVITQPNITTSRAVAYDPTLNQQMFQRTASITLHVRILERDGSVNRDLDITGTHSQLVAERWLEKQRGD